MSDAPPPPPLPSGETDETTGACARWQELANNLYRDRLSDNTLASYIDVVMGRPFIAPDVVHIETLLRERASLLAVLELLATAMAHTADTTVATAGRMLVAWFSAPASAEPPNIGPVLAALRVERDTLAGQVARLEATRVLQTAALSHCLARLTDDHPVRTSFNGWVAAQARAEVLANPDEYDDHERAALAGADGQEAG